LKIFVIGSDGSLEVILLGKNPNDGQVPQAVIHSSKWFGGMPIEDNSFTLIGCTVAPSFEFEEFELGKKEEMIKQYPQHKNIIEILT
jgi:predicted cupin superfamily sugar epimerase